jgi:hypothetical protein
VASERRCVACDGPLAAYAGRGRPRLYCSRVCRRGAEYARRRAARRERWARWQAEEAERYVRAFG